MNSRKFFERDLLSSDSVAKSATQNLGFSQTVLTTSDQDRGGQQLTSSTVQYFPYRMKHWKILPAHISRASHDRNPRQFNRREQPAVDNKETGASAKNCQNGG